MLFKTSTSRCILILRTILFCSALQPLPHQSMHLLSLVFWRFHVVQCLKARSSSNHSFPLFFSNSIVCRYWLIALPVHKFLHVFLLRHAYKLYKVSLNLVEAVFYDFACDNCSILCSTYFCITYRLLFYSCIICSNNFSLHSNSWMTRSYSFCSS